MAVEDIEDGSSTTVMIDEIRVGTVNTDIRGTWAMGIASASIVAGSGRGDGAGPNQSLAGWDDVEGGINDVENGMGACINCGSNQVTMKSKHPGGAFACFADGSVRFVVNSISQINYQLIHCRDDGHAINGVTTNSDPY